MRSKGCDVISKEEAAQQVVNAQIFLQRMRKYILSLKNDWTDRSQGHA